jgi:hypothetical protein
MSNTDRFIIGIIQKVARKTKKKVTTLKLEINEDPEAFAEKYAKHLTPEEQEFLTGSSSQT